MIKLMKVAVVDGVAPAQGKNVRKLLHLVAAVMMTVGVLAATAGPAAAYSPGRAVAYRPVYSVGADGWSYHCSFPGWRSGAKVIWHCDLHEIFLGDAGWEDVLIAPHSGSWTPGSSTYTTPTWVRKLNAADGELCLEAYALSVDGGVTQRTCAS
jgi:hypothetical protein